MQIDLSRQVYLWWLKTRFHMVMGNAKYGLYTDKIYQSIFKEKAKEYRQVLKLSEKERIRDTFYSEILTLISYYECGLVKVRVIE